MGKWEGYEGKENRMKKQYKMKTKKYGEHALK